MIRVNNECLIKEKVIFGKYTSKDVLFYNTSCDKERSAVAFGDEVVVFE